MSARVPKRNAAPPPGKGGEPPIKGAGPGGAGVTPKKKPPQHYKVGRLIFTPISIAELCGVLVLGILGIVFLISAYKDFLLKINLDRALVFYASNQVGNANERLTAAMGARGVDEWPYPTYLLAKVATNEGKLDDAEQAFERLKTVKVGENNWSKQHLASVYVGLGCVYLRRYDDSLEANKPNMSLLEKAKGAFNDAQVNDDKCLEAGIGLAHVAMRRGWEPTPAPGKINADAIEIASKELKKVDAMTLTPTIDGLVDKYMAQGRIAYEKEDYSGAELEFRRAFQLQPSWKAPFADVAFMMARYFIASGTSRLDEMKAKQQEYDDFINRLESLYNSDTQRYAIFKQAMYSFYNSMGYAFAKGFRPEIGLNYMDCALAFEKGKATVYVNKADIFYYYSRSNKFDETQQMTYASNAREEWLHAAEVCRATQEPKKRFLCLLNRAIIFYVMKPLDSNYQDTALSDLAQIAREFPDEPLLLRNQGMVHYSKGQITDAVKSWRAAGEAAKKSPLSDEEKKKFDEEMQNLERDAASGK